MFKRLQLLNKPMITVSREMLTKMINTGHHAGVKDASKVYVASAQLPANDRMIPVMAAKAPKKKYSSAVMMSICLRLAPSVRSNTVSCMR